MLNQPTIHPDSIYGRAITQIQMSNGDKLHEAGFKLSLIHILLVNPANRGLSPWYELSDNDEGKLYTPEWVFEKKDLKRFK